MPAESLRINLGDASLCVKNDPFGSIDGLTYKTALNSAIARAAVIVYKRKHRSKILFSRYECIRYAVSQMMQGALTLRISGKNGKNKPKIVYRVGKEDKLIKDYLEICERALDRPRSIDRLALTVDQ